MKREIVFKALALSILSLFFLTSCGLPPPGTPLTPEERERAKNQCIAQYTIGGTVLGGISGALLGGGKGRGGQGAIIGASAGGALAYLIAYGKCFAYFYDTSTFPAAGYQDTMRNENYKPADGNIVRIKDFNAIGEARQGQKLKFEGSYYVMAPQEMQDVTIKETRTAYFYDTSKKEWKELGSVEKENTIELGTRKIDDGIDITEKTPEGKYRIDLKISALGKEDVASAEYVVKKATAFEKFLNFVMAVFE